MTNTAHPVLCGGTFLVQILQSRKPTASRRQRTKGSTDIFREPDVLFELVKIVQPDYIRPAGDTFRTYTTNYKKCAKYTPDDLKFMNDSVVSEFLTRLEKEYDSELNKMAAFVNQFIEVSPTTKNHVLLVKRLIEIIRDDKSISTTVKFTVGRDNSLIAKNELADVTEVYLPAFLLSIWKFIVTQRKDNSIGATTIAAWFPKETGRYNGISGLTIKQEIRVDCDPLDTIDVIADINDDDVSEANVKGTEETAPTTGPQVGAFTLKKNLLDLFKDAIDEFYISEFVDSDYSVMPLRMNLVKAVNTFIETVRYHLRSFRRQQDDVFKNVILFVNTVEQYSHYLSTKMFSGDDNGKFSKWMWNNTTEDLEAACKYRHTINSLYGLISGGGSLSVFGCASADDDDETVLKKLNIESKQSNAITVERSQINTDYYNLFVISDEIKNCRFTIQKDRSLRSDTKTVKKFADFNAEAIKQITSFPSLFMNENIEYGGCTSPEQEAFYGFVTDLRVQENGVIKVYFRCEAKVNQQQINNIARLLDIYEGPGVMELNHTHWTIKNVNLIEELIDANLLPNENATGYTAVIDVHE